MGACRLLLLGPPQIQTDSRVGLLPLKKAVALAAYLAVEQRSFSREYLAALLWPEHDQQRALANLRRTLVVLRERIASDCITAEGDQVRMDCGALEVDVHQFRSLAQPAGTDVARLEEAAALHRGSFLEGFNLGDCPEFDEWQDGVRERLRSELDDLLGDLCAAHLKSGRPKLAIPVALRWLERDGLNEAAHRAIMEAYAATGRTDLAHKQYQTCVRNLAREGIEPDERTLRLHNSVMEHRVAAAVERPEAPPEAATERTAPPPVASRRRRTRLIALGAAALVLVSAALNVYFLRFRIFGSDLSVGGLEVLRRDGTLDAIRVALVNDGPGVQSVDYQVIFQTDESFRKAHDYVVYADAVRIRRNRTMGLQIDDGDILEFIRRNDVRIPPGNYTARVLIDPDFRHGERSKTNNRASSSDRFFTWGSDAAEVIEVQVLMKGPVPLDEENPLRLFVGDLSEGHARAWEEWGTFRVTREGSYYLPLEDALRWDTDSSGYFLLLVHDAGANLRDPRFLGPGDVAGLYKEVADNVVYGPFRLDSGTLVEPGRRYQLTFSHVPFPLPDVYEGDDVPDLGTVVRMEDLPVRQYHTFHLDEPGGVEPDEDWYRIVLPRGESFTVETRSAGGRWESDTGLDLSDAAGNYIRSGRHVTLTSTYKTLTYMNDTGSDQAFSLVIQPYSRPSYCVEQIGEYVVEFRR